MCIRDRSSGGAGAGTLTGGSLCLDGLGGGEGLLSGVDHLQMEDTPPTELFTHDAGQGTALGFGDIRHFKGCLLYTSSESTFRLPAAQMDRFLIRISMGYPTPKEERRMLRNLGDEIPFDQVRPVTNAQELVEAQRQISQVHLSDAVADYIVALAAATRSHPQLKMGASPRATRGLYRAAKVWAAMEGRDFVTPDDVKTLAAPVLEHRLILDSGARFSGVSVSAILDDVLERLQGAPELEAVAHEK